VCEYRYKFLLVHLTITTVNTGCKSKTNTHSVATSSSLLDFPLHLRMFVVFVW